MEQANVQTLIDAIEHADCITPHMIGHCEYTTVAGVLVCTTPTDDPMSNKAMLARLNADDADDAISKVKQYFAANSKPFGWIVGPGTTPHDLGARLERHGFELFLTVEGMYYPDLNSDIPQGPSAHVFELPVNMPGPAVDIMARGFNMSVETSIKLHETLALCAGALRPRIYAASVDGVETPVACAYLSRFPDRSIAVLCGGTTLPDYRGRGLYSALLTRRLADIAKDGVEQVIILADQRTSAPICLKAGFVKVCELQMYVWRTEKSASVSKESAR